MSRASRTLRAALLAPANVIALLTAGGASLVTGHSLPALVALGAEAVYLGAVGLVPSLRSAVGARAGAPDDDETERLLAELAESQREHYFVLRDLRDSILENYRKLPGGGVLAASSEAQLAVRAVDAAGTDQFPGRLLRINRERSERRQKRCEPHRTDDHRADGFKLLEQSKTVGPAAACRHQRRLIEQLPAVAQECKW